MSLKEKAESKAKEYQVADVCRVWNNGCPNIYYASMEMFEWTKQELIDKACEWLKFNYTEFLNDSRIGIDIDEMVKDFKIDMKGE